MKPYGILWKLRFYLVEGYWPVEDDMILEDEYLPESSRRAFIEYGGYRKHGDRFLEPEMRGK